MPGNKAWQRHGCYHLGAEALLALPLLKASLGCQDGLNLLDHFDPTADVRRFFKQLVDLRANYRALDDGFALVQRGNWTHDDYLPYSNGPATERSSASDTSLSILSENFSIVAWVSCKKIRTEVPVLSAGAVAASPTDASPVFRPGPETAVSLFSK